jgi:DNA-binding response OmpR family regulator
MRSGCLHTVAMNVEPGCRPAPRVLIVEDNTLIAMDLEAILKSNGCEVVGPTAGVEAALDAVGREDIDVAVVDYVLEDGDAAPLAKMLDEKGIPFAICTGSVEGEMSALFPNTPILGKPYNPDDVALVVNSLIASRLASA